VTRRPVVLIVLASALACGPAPEPHDRPVATIAGAPLTRGELDAYLEKNLAGTEPADGEIDDENERGDLVRSLLLDTWIDERLILAEAAVRGLSIDNERLDEMLDDPAYESGDEDRRRQRVYLRDRLLIELVQGQVLHDVEFPTAAAAAEWLSESAGTSSTEISVRLRSLRFDDASTALEVHRSLRNNRLTFNEAVVQNTEDESQGAPTVVELASLPPEVQQALENLQPGWSSTPVELGGSTYLFQLVSWIEQDSQARIETARTTMFSATRRVAWERFVTGLRERESVRIVRKNLPFRYLSEESE